LPASAGSIVAIGYNAVPQHPAPGKCLIMGIRLLCLLPDPCFDWFPPPSLMRFLVFLLTALCLSALSFPAAANVRADAVQAEAVDYAMQAADDDLSQLVLPGDPDYGEDEVADDGPPPGYCNIWSADLLDPLDLFDAVDETSALFVLPSFQLPQSVDDLVQPLAARTTFESEGVFRPPNLLG